MVHFLNNRLLKDSQHGFTDAKKNLHNKRA
jgi:hypothetical protein